MNFQERHRKMLRGAVAVATGAVLAADQTWDPALNERRGAALTREGKNKASIETANASYVIEYGAHDQESSVSILDAADGLILEGPVDFSSKEKVAETAPDFMNYAEYRKTLARALAQKLPVFLVDSVFMPDTISQPLSDDENEKRFLKAFETALGIGLPASRLVAPQSIELRFTRRDFLFKTGLAVGGVYFLSHVPDKLLHDAARTTGDIKDESSIVRKTEKLVGTLNAEIHPEARTKEIDLRNTLIAQKSETAASMLAGEIGRHPKLALEIGADHFAIEHELQRSPAGRIETLKKEFGPFLKSQAIIARFDPYKKGMKISFFYDRAMQEA